MATNDPCSRVKPITPPGYAVGLATAVACGTAFGFALQKGHVFEPEHILGQMRMQKFFMIKMFLSAACFSLFSTGLVYLFPFGRSRLCAARKWVFNGYRGAIAGVIGGLIVGAGMATTGACPGTVLAQVGTGVQWSLLTLLGCFLGAIVFAHLEPRFLKPTGLLNSCCMANAPSLDVLFGIHFTVIAWPLGIVFGAIAFFFETLFPWRTELANEGFIVPQDSSIISPYALAWPPMMAGLVIGLLQLPLLLLAGETLGASRSYVSVYANAVHAVSPATADSNAYLTGARTGLGNWSQVLFVCFAAFGAFLSAYLSGGIATSAPAFSPMRSLVGGFLIVFGARLAGGCTSGQGLSGNALLANISPLVTAAMFGGGMLTAFLFL